MPIQALDVETLSKTEIDTAPTLIFANLLSDLTQLQKNASDLIYIKNIHISLHHHLKDINREPSTTLPPDNRGETSRQSFDGDMRQGEN
jgi:hypothetical protein